MPTDAKIDAAKPRDRACKLANAGQLCLLVSPAGGRHWRIGYAYGKNADGRTKQNTLSLGRCPAITLRRPA